MADREWMYTGFESKSVEWVRGTDNFLKEAFSEVVAKGSFRMSCPCTKCKNQKKKDYTHVQRYFRERIRSKLYPLGLPW
jgi:hypothetical protein